MEKLSTTKSNSAIFTQDINESQVENLKKAKISFLESEKIHMEE